MWWEGGGGGCRNQNYSCITWFEFERQTSDWIRFEYDYFTLIFRPPSHFVHFQNWLPKSSLLENCPSPLQNPRPPLGRNKRSVPYLWTSEPRGVTKTSLPETFACLFYLQRTFGNPLRAVFSKIEIFPATSKFSSLYMRGLLGCLLGFWPGATKCDSLFYYKVRQALLQSVTILFQSAMIITKSNRTWLSMDSPKWCW